MVATKGYGLSIKDICRSCPTDMKPYKDAYECEIRVKDESDWRLGMYFQSALEVALDHAFNGSKAKSKYLDKPILDVAREISNETDEQKIRKMIQVEKQWQLRGELKGLPTASDLLNKGQSN